MSPYLDYGPSPEEIARLVREGEEAAKKRWAADPWPRCVAMYSAHGKITIEAHAPWCPREQARRVLAGNDADAVSFCGLVVDCLCEDGNERAKYESFTALVPSEQ